MAPQINLEKKQILLNHLDFFFSYRCFNNNFSRTTSSEPRIIHNSRDIQKPNVTFLLLFFFLIFDAHPPKFKASRVQNARKKENLNHLFDRSYMALIYHTHGFCMIFKKCIIIYSVEEEIPWTDSVNMPGSKNLWGKIASNLFQRRCYVPQMKKKKHRKKIEEKLPHYNNIELYGIHRVQNFRHKACMCHSMKLFICTCALAFLLYIYTYVHDIYWFYNACIHVYALVHDKNIYSVL